ncbi:hypothetical protein [Thalassobellus suaedae]|uniref:Uncharacterized protein n=1 Tax=Thalassobellus suaedae TaxID=3074124 RepID=A0ABY9Y718_9FLAO|nr:hypothetical protein RHP49_07370 [Flavobacteriaceae bacterium HL-DH10]
MKKLCYALLFLLIAFKSFSQETEKLPKEPWEEIVEINGQRYSLLKKWNSDIKVQLEGNYTTTDSLNITKVLAKLNAITESINIGFSKDEIANLKISFIDANVNERDKYGEMLRMFSKDQKGFTKGKLYIYSSKSNPNFNNSLESTISKALVGGFFSPLFQNKRNSIFNRAVNYNNSKVPLNAKDIAIIKEAYKPDFEKKLQIANKQFKHILDDLYTKKVKARDRIYGGLQTL